MKNQFELLTEINRKYNLSAKVQEAFLKCPRHLFINRPYSIEEIYSDYPLEIYRDEQFISTISQPSFVLLMLGLLQLNSRDKVLELGTGSGWNAALMSCLCHSVVSLEIIPELAREASARLKKLGFKNIQVIGGDGAFGYSPGAPYDKGVFTAGAADLPGAFHEQIKVGGLLLFVLRTPESDLLLLLEKKLDHFEELKRIPCSFVPLKGEKAQQKEFDSTVMVGPTGQIQIYPRRQEGNDSIISIT